MTRGLRTSLIVMTLCVAAFGGCFAIGRAERPKSATGAELSSSQQPASAGASIPLALRGAPPIDMRGVKAINHATRRAGAGRKSPLPQVAVSAETSGTLSARTGTQAASAPEAATPVGSSEHLGASTHTSNAGAGHTRHAPAAKTESNASHSFDSSD